MTQDTQKHSGGIVKRLVDRVRTGGTNTPATSKESSPAPEEHTTLPRRRTTFKLGGTSSTKSPTVDGSGKSKRRDDTVCLSLWDEAYDSLRLKPKTTSLVTTYESIIAQELPDNLKTSVNSTLSSDDPARRLELLEIIATNGLKKRRGSNNSSVDESVKVFVNGFKELIEETWERYRATPLAWAGICTMTPLLVETILTNECIKDGLLHVTGRLSWYMHLSLLLLGDNWRDLQLFTERKDQVRSAILDLYARLLEFEMNCICASASSWNNAAKHVVPWQGLPELVRELQEADARMAQLVDETAADKVRGDLLSRKSMMGALELVVPPREDGAAALSRVESHTARAE
ncbi:hypothetical protein NLU13_6603 [Sarocladium strictum]|uniref:NWD NACHT-NTPase N-terminal domain-containing protein n=1 Tax=Sarocladium strictum TaxID=5046 RepID=A0AA39GG70_SARSR|nr:hypothetical protein NLU13_6603 [Sarocladium strictum]